MINEEQAEAALASLKDSCRRNERKNGWRFGRQLESRRDRIKRIRRWRKIEFRYPDRMKPWDTKPIDREQPKCILHKQFDRFEIMITECHRKVPPELDAPEWIWRDFESWDELIQYNGYCRFMAKPVVEPGYKGILNYVPVHGGITYASFRAGTATYGFDTAHCDDAENPLVRNLEWVEFQAWFMARAIRLAALFESDYLRSTCNYHRARVIDSYHAKVAKLTQQPFQIGNNFGSMINLLCGKL